MITMAKANFTIAKANVLSPNARNPSNFEDENGPGYLALAGPRHDNDHVMVANIKILPTADEVGHRTLYLTKFVCSL